MVPWITSRSDTLKAIGAIAQLGERLICIQEVVGSIPSGSTRGLSDSDRGTTVSGAVYRSGDDIVN